MDIQIYSCDNTFPLHIENVLKEKGYQVEPTPELNFVTDKIHGAFSFRIQRGLGSLKVLGSPKKEIFTFHMVCDNKPGPHSWNASDIMYDTVERILLTNGADLYAIEEL